MAAQHRQASPTRQARPIERCARALGSASAQGLLLVACYAVAILLAQAIAFARSGHYSGTACALHREISGGDACHAYVEGLTLGRTLLTQALVDANALSVAALAAAALIALRAAGEAVRARADRGAAEVASGTTA